MTDLEVLNFFINNDRVNSNKIKRITNNQISEDIKTYLDNRFADISDSYSEIINRIRYKIETRPVCKNCASRVKWISKNKYREFCSCSCKNSYQFKIIQEKTIQKYGSSFNRQKFKKTIIDKYGHNNWCNNNKRKETFANKSKEEKQNIVNKSKLTKLTKYGIETYNNIEQIRLSTFLHYGVDNYRKTTECKDKIRNNYIINKDKIETKKKLTNIKNTGYAAFNIKKTKQTKLEKYGDSYYNNRNKYTETCLNKYGVYNIYNLDYYKEKSHNEESKHKQYITKKYNNSFNTSKPEDESYAILKEYYPDVMTQYKDDRYPFACDFYIPSLDLFIECNYYWTHGGKPYEGTEDDKQIVEKWKAKNTKFYINAIQTWTVRDVNKRNIAKQNKLNYIEVWNIKEIHKFSKYSFENT